MGNIERSLDPQIWAGESQLWASYIVLSPLDMTSPTAQQRTDYEGYAMNPEQDDIIAAKLAVSGETYARWGFSFDLKADTGIAAIQRSVSVVTRGLEKSAIEIADLEFVGAHLVSHKSLLLKNKILSNDIDVTNETFNTTDALRRHAHNRFYAIRNRAAAIAALDNGELAAQQTIGSQVKLCGLANTQLS
jgi:hypothetical protein